MLSDFLVFPRCFVGYPMDEPCRDGMLWEMKPNLWPRVPEIGRTIMPLCRCVVLVISFTSEYKKCSFLLLPSIG